MYNKISLEDVKKIPLRKECFEEMCEIILLSNLKAANETSNDNVKLEYITKLYYIFASYLTIEGQLILADKVKEISK